MNTKKLVIRGTVCVDDKPYETMGGTMRYGVYALSADCDTCPPGHEWEPITTFASLEDLPELNQTEMAGFLWMQGYEFANDTKANKALREHFLQHNEGRTLLALRRVRR